MADMADIKLQPDHQKALMDAGANVVYLQRQIDKLQRAGIDATSLKAQLQKAEQLRLGLLREFGTGG